MEITPESLKERVAALGLGLPDKFSSLVIEGALIALRDQNNPLRVNFFSTAMRILYEHTMDRLSPREEVAGDSDEDDRWFRTDGDQRSEIDVISRRSEATLANGFCRK